MPYQYHRFDEVCHIEVRLLLGAVAQDEESIGRLPQLLNEVVDHAMRASRADDVGEARDPALDPVILTIRADEGLRCELGCAVMRDWMERAEALGDRAICFTVYRRGRRKHQLFDVGAAHRIEYSGSCQERVVEIDRRRGMRAGDVRIGRQVKHAIKVSALHQLVKRAVQDIGPDEPKSWVIFELPNVALASERQIVNCDHFMAKRDQGVAKMTAYE